MESMLSVLLCMTLGYAWAVNEGTFWHLTDFHWDFSYWTDQLSCNGMNITNPGVFGSEWCDSPWKLVEQSIVGIKEVKQDVDFILWTGDTVPHVNSANLSTELNKELVRNVTEAMKQAFPSTKVYATFGNHDYYPANMFPLATNEIYNATYELWEQWINESSQTENFLKAKPKEIPSIIRLGGYYTLLVQPKVRLVALNTNLYYFKATLANTNPDPADQLAWLDDTLTAAANVSEKVILTGHVPPGYTTPRKVRWMTKVLNQKFVDVILRHSDVIVAMHFGHEHHDNFRLFYNKERQAVVPLFLAPSVTPWRYQIGTEIEPPHNPGARLVRYDRDSGKQLDIVQYYVDLDEVNRDGTFQWVLGYNATDMYAIPDVTAASMGEVVKKMTGPTTPVFKSFVKWYNTNGKAQSEYPCDADCYHTVMCGLQHMTEEAFNQCLTAGQDTSGSMGCQTQILLGFVLPLFCAVFWLGNHN